MVLIYHHCCWFIINGADLPSLLLIYHNWCWFIINGADLSSPLVLIYHHHWCWFIINGADLSSLLLIYHNWCWFIINGADLSILFKLITSRADLSCWMHLISGLLKQASQARLISWSFQLDKRVLWNRSCLVLTDCLIC